jgi:hypothetical protein
MRCIKGPLVGLIAVLALLAAPAALAALAPAVSTGNASSVTASSATLAGTVNPEGQATTYQFEYGTTTAYGNVTAATSAGSGTGDVAVMAMIGSLAPNTTYHFRIVATNGSGTTPGTDKTFKTAQAPAQPFVTTGAAKSVTGTSATLTGTVNPEGQATTYQFRYGPTTAYGNTTPSTSAGSGTSAAAVTAMIGALTPNTTYHFRLVATNAAGTTLGSDKTFKTAKPSSSKPSSLRIKASPNPIVFGQTTTVSGSVKATGSASTTVTLQQAPSGTGPFTTVARTTSSNGGGYSFRVSPRSNTFYRTVASGVTSSSVRVAVRFRIGLSAGTTHPTPGQLVRFHGQVAPAHNGFRVRIQRLASNGSWHTLARPLLHATSGNASTYSVRIAVHRGGLYRATVGPDAHNARGFSHGVRITLR